MRGVEGLMVLAAVWLLAIPAICLGLAIWRSARLRTLADRVDQLEYLLERFKGEVGQLRKRLDELVLAPPAAQPPPPPAAEPLVREPIPVPPTKPGIPPPPPAPVEAPPEAEAILPAPPRIEPPPVIPAPPVAVPQPALRGALTEAVRKPLRVDWERFMGTKLLNWIGGLALFLAVALLVKHSIDRNWITPQLRVAAGSVMGVGLLIGGMALKRKAYEITSQTLCAAGVVILYTVSFASCTPYHFISPTAAFLLMTLITVVAFLLAAQMNALVVAILGLLGGFLTPPMLSTGVDRPLGLFGYIAILDAGLIAMAVKRRWHFLVALAALGTVVMQIGWAAKFFEVPKAAIALRIFLAFDVLFLLSYAVADRLKQASGWLAGAAAALPLVALGFTFALLDYSELGQRPGLVFVFMLQADLALLALVLLRPQFHPAHLIGGLAVFLLLAFWTWRWLTVDLLDWALGAYFCFAVLHGLFPVLLQRFRAGVSPMWWGHLFPPLALLLALAPLSKELQLSWLFWPMVLLIDVVAILLSLLTATLVSIALVLALTVLVTAVWIVKVPAELTHLPPLLFVIGGFAVFFALIGLIASKHILPRLRGAKASAQGPPVPAAPEFLRAFSLGPDAVAQIPALSAILPFLLLILAAVRMPLTDPSPVYALALLLVVLLLGLARVFGVSVLAPVGLACVLALEYAWHQQRFNPDHPYAVLAWNHAFAAAFIVFPFMFRQALANRVLPWATAALSGPLHFYLVYRVVKLAFPNQVMGVLPAVFALPMVLALLYVARNFPTEQKPRTTLLAWFGGSALFFVTLIIPIQFEKQWITIGWALEGAALLWLFHRVPHPGLRLVGVVLLAVAFARLTFNPAVFQYHPRSDVRVFNWYLYAYGLVTVCLMAGARLLAPPRNRVLGASAPAVLYALGTVLAFLLLNIEIADYYSKGPTLTFQFRGSFAQDMTYSIGWALFALGMLIVGVWKRLAAARYAGLALLLVTVGKLFLHDLTRLQALYRVGAFVGVAVIAMVASVLYQRFFAARAERDQSPDQQKE